MLKKYRVSHEWFTWECQVEIDADRQVDGFEKFNLHTTYDLIKSMVEFWGEWKFRLEMNDSDYVKTFLQQLASKINYIQTQYNYNLKGVIDQFPQEEGWFKMDGSLGIKIVSIDDFKFEDSDYQVREVIDG